MDNNRIAVLMTVHNRKTATLECLDRLYKQTDVSRFVMDVYLTDDGCTDGTPQAVRERFPDVRILEGDGNLFWNRGMYKAWEEAAKQDYDYYLWLNDDTFLESGALAAMLAASDESHGEAIIVGVVSSLDGSKTTYGGRIQGKVPAPEGHLAEVETFNGNVVLVPKSVYKKLGNLDNYFAHSKGDFDYGMRAVEAGIKIYQTGEYVGKCDAHPHLDKWCNPAVPLKERLRMLNRPNGMPPKETFYLERKHIGFFPACFHYFTIYLRCFLPWIWTRRK